MRFGFFVSWVCVCVLLCSHDVFRSFFFIIIIMCFLLLRDSNRLTSLQCIIYTEAPHWTTFLEPPCFVVTSRVSCCINPTYLIKTNFARELLSEWSGRIHCQVVLYAEDVLVYINQLFTRHRILLFSLFFDCVVFLRDLCPSLWLPGVRLTVDVFMALIRGGHQCRANVGMF